MNFVYFAGCGDMVKVGVTRTVYQRIMRYVHCTGRSGRGHCQEGIYK